MEHNNKLKTLHEKIERRNLLEKEMKLLYIQIAELKSKWFTLKENAEKEAADVTVLEKNSITSFMARISGHLEEQLEKEQREARTAHAAYEKVETSLQAGKVRIAEIVSELEILREENIDEEYETLLKEKRRAMELRQNMIPENLQKVEAELAHLETQLAVMQEVKTAAAAAEIASKQLEDTISDAKAYMEFAGYGLRNPIEAGLKRKADQNIDAMENDSKDFMETMLHYRDLLLALNGTENFHIPFEYLEDLSRPHSTDNFLELTDIAGKMRKFWARIYKSLKLLNQLEEAMQMELNLKKEQWKQLVFDY